MKKAFFSGNIANDPELRGTDHKALTFRVACNTRILNSQTGEWEDSADFFPFVVFGKRAEALSNYLVKGTNVTIEATPSHNVWVAQDGTKRSQIEFIIDDINFVNRRPVAQPQPQVAQALDNMPVVPDMVPLPGFYQPAPAPEAQPMAEPAL